MPLSPINGAWRGFLNYVTDRTRTDCTIKDRPQSQQFESVSLLCLRAGLRVRFQARGASMSPAIRDGEMVYVKPSPGESLHRGDIVLVKGDSGFRLHRLIQADVRRDVFITRGDSGLQDDPAVRRAQILGVAVAKDVQVGRAAVTARFKGPRGKLLRTLARGQAALRKVVIGTRGCDEQVHEVR
jgi:hypothetical protein